MGWKKFRKINKTVFYRGDIVLSVDYKIRIKPVMFPINLLNFTKPISIKVK